MIAEVSGRRGERAALRSLARHHGILSSFIAEGGQRVSANDESLIGVLRALGVELTAPKDAPGLLTAVTAEWRPIQPVLVARQGSRAIHQIELPARLDPERVELTLHREDGSSTTRPLSELLAARSSKVDSGGGRRALHRIRLGAALSVAPGYHRLEVTARGLSASATVIAAPRRCPIPERGWGVFAPIHALRRDDDWGVGTFGDLAELGAWARGLGASFVGTLPMNATFLRGPLADPSPYRPVSRLAWNELFIDVDKVPELPLVAAAKELRSDLVFVRVLEALRSGDFADPERVLANKRAVLQLLADAMHVGSFRRRSEFEEFCVIHPEVEEYARFRATTEHLERTWRHWSDAERTASAALDDTDAAVRYHRYVQWIADGQLKDAASAAGLFMDLPVGVHPEGFDPFHFPGSFASRAMGGASPDIFQPAGQNWSVTPLHPEGVRDDGYRYVISYLRHAMRHATMVRIDHVMGLHRLWWVPDGMSAAEGAYVRYHSEELRAIVVLEAARAGVGVVGEDLGTVAPSVRNAMRTDGMLRSHVHQFAATPMTPLPDPADDSIATLGSHDLPTFATWWAANDVDERVLRGHLSEAEAEAGRTERAEIRQMTPVAADAAVETALEVHLGHLAAGPAQLVMVDLEDLWSERAPQNRPGTGAEERNFRRRWMKRWPEDLCGEASRPTVVLRELDRLRRLGATSSTSTASAGPTEADR